MDKFHKADLVLLFYCKKGECRMAMTKRELIQFMDELVELASEENKTRAILVKEKFISDFEKSYEYEKEVCGADSSTETTDSV